MQRSTGAFELGGPFSWTAILRGNLTNNEDEKREKMEVRI